METTVSLIYFVNGCSFDENIYTCKTCVKYLKKDSVPPCSIANGFQFPKIPNDYQICSN